MFCTADTCRTHDHLRSNSQGRKSFKKLIVKKKSLKKVWHVSFSFEALLALCYVVDHPPPPHQIIITFMWFLVCDSLCRITSLLVPWPEETRTCVQTDPTLRDTHCCKMAKKTGERSTGVCVCLCLCLPFTVHMTTNYNHKKQHSLFSSSFFVRTTVNGHRV